MEFGLRTFVIRSRQGTTHPERIRLQVGARGHLEVVAHCVLNAFFYSCGFRDDVEVYVVLDSAPDFPRTVHFSAQNGLSLAGFHEEAVYALLEQAMRMGINMPHESVREAAPGVRVMGFGFERLFRMELAERPVFVLSPKGEDARLQAWPQNPVFVLSDHLEMPKNSIKGLLRQGATRLSLGRRMLFASQCIVLLHHEMDRALSL
ncbi:tRNA (pseudouridine(54)-N(1))-methyltransferase TrmY [Legionella geestiana]|nr:tRNA (pseudouridine(54)-N(1))-methyltransferase TrmY [Legionella geestiana]